MPIKSPAIYKWVDQNGSTRTSITPDIFETKAEMLSLCQAELGDKFTDIKFQWPALDAEGLEIWYQVNI